LISWIRYVPNSEIAKLTVPALVLQGTTDIQVPVSAAQALKAAKPDAVLDIVEGMNHVLKIVPADRPRQIASYSDPTLPIAPELTQAIVAFVRSLGH
jgi:pimeloyl-ACP methyl ester carboxylesterase